jgi:hypothetical protein
MRDENNKEVVGNKETRKKKRSASKLKRERERKKINYKGERRKGVVVGVLVYLEFSAVQIWLP